MQKIDIMKSKVITMLELPISDYVKNYYREHNFAFDDFAKAAIIWNSYLGWQERIAMLQELADDTSDEALKLQVKDCIGYELQEQACFMDNADRNYIYRVTEYDDSSGHCYFTTIEKALAYGKDNCEDYILIDKIMLDPEDGRDIVGTCKWDKNGSTILKFSSFFCSNVPENTYGKEERFENAFISCEYPFERGDIVRHILTDEIGVIETSRADWEALLQRAESDKSSYDIYDLMVSVDYVSETGKIGYDHDQMLHLEKVTECTSKAETDLMKCISDLLQGKEMLWTYHYYLERYVNSIE